MANQDICTTRKAANLLGLSIRSVQQLVEKGSIAAWKTPGGHRRISLAAIDDYQQSFCTAYKNAVSLLNINIFIVVKDCAEQRGFYKENILLVDRRADLRYVENVSRAMLEIAQYRPDILLVDIENDGGTLIGVINNLLRFPELAPDNIAIVSSHSLESISHQFCIPSGVALFIKPVNVDELRGYLLACRSIKVRALDRTKRQAVTA